MVRDEWIQGALPMEIDPEPIEVRLFVGINPDRTFGHVTVHFVGVPSNELLAAASTSGDHLVATRPESWHRAAEMAFFTLAQLVGPFD